LMEDLPISGFEPIYNGNNLNSAECPVPSIVKRADAVALFAATMGLALADKSSELFTKGGAALGYMLDAVNSVAAEQLGQRMCLRFLQLLPEELRKAKELKVQYYCPGHCGWHLSGQEKVFESLQPGEIGIALSSGWAMYPVKSISGVLIAAPIEVHRFAPGFEFCKLCKEHKCVSRLKLLESIN
jgi:cobalamin-dependent methionine synthase I